jgi:hypothetical protein
MPCVPASLPNRLRRSTGHPCSVTWGWNQARTGKACCKNSLKVTLYVGKVRGALLQIRKSIKFPHVQLGSFVAQLGLPTYADQEDSSKHPQLFFSTVSFSGRSYDAEEWCVRLISTCILPALTYISYRGSRRLISKKLAQQSAAKVAFRALEAEFARVGITGVLDVTSRIFCRCSRRPRRKFARTVCDFIITHFPLCSNGDAAIDRAQRRRIQPCVCR